MFQGSPNPFYITLPSKCHKTIKHLGPEALRCPRRRPALAFEYIFAHICLQAIVNTKNIMPTYWLNEHKLTGINSNLFTSQLKKSPEVCERTQIKMQIVLCIFDNLIITLSMQRFS